MRNIVISLLCIVSCLPAYAQSADKTARSDAFYWKNSKGTLLLHAADHTVVGQLANSKTGSIRFSDAITSIDPATFKITRRYTVAKDVDSVSISLDFIHASPCAYWMIPAVSYNGNNYGRGKEPKGAQENGLWRTYSYRRTPIPGALYSEGDRFAVATWGDTPTGERDDYSCSIEPREKQTVHRLIWPEEELPQTYSNRDRYSQGFRKYLKLKKGESVTLTMYLTVSVVKPHHQAVQHFMHKAWEYADKPVVAVENAEQLWDLGIRYATESLWAEEGSFKGFSIGLHSDEKGWVQRKDYKYEIGWCGQNASLANSLLVDYIRNQHPKSLEKGLAALDTWAEHCPLPNGLFVTHYDNILSNNTNFVMDACNLGAAALNYFEAFDLTKTIGKDRPQYERIAFGICDFVKADQQANGVYARGWRPDGTAYVREGTIGCFMVPPMLEAYKRSQDASYLLSAQKAYNYYMNELKTDGYTTAGALDTWCIDKESSMPLLRSSLMLYQITGDREYLDNAVAASYYLSTWMWHYQGIYPADDNFSVYGYNTFGATSVSVQHHHLDNYALYWVTDWIKLSDLTGDPQWKEKALAVWRNGSQLVSDGTLNINGRVRPAGSQNEAFFESHWQFGAGERINSWLVAWPGAFRLETLRHPEGRRALVGETRADTLLSLLHDASGNYVFVVAHRGDWRNAPENSLKAMERSIKMGVDMVEIDIRMTKDSVLVLMHDGSIDRTTTGKGRVSDYTLAELRQFYLKDGLGVVLTQQIPTLKEVMLLCKDKILVNADKASDYMDKVQEVLKETGTEKQVVYKGYRPYAAVKQQYGDLLNQIIYMPIVIDNTKGLDTVVVDFIKHYKPVAFEVIFGAEDSPMNAAVKTMKTSGCRVWVNSLWGNMNAGHNDERAVDEPDACWGWLIDYGASIIQTDRPKELIEYLESKNKRITK